MLDEHVWQVPLATITIITGILIAAFNFFNGNILLSNLLLFFGVLLSFTMFVTINKYRFFQYYAIERIRQIERRLSLDPMPLVSGKDGMDHRNFLDSLKAGTWLNITMFLIFYALAVLLICNILRFFIGKF